MTDYGREPKLLLSGAPTRHASIVISFSVIIAAYQAENTLQDALKSVASQSVSDWECIIVDDGSTDRTTTIAKDWCSIDTRFSLIVLPSNEGPSAARNRGLSVARGEWIAILDADDSYESNRLYKLREAAERLRVAVIFDNQWLWAPSDRTRRRWLDLRDDDLRRYSLNRFLYQVSGFSGCHWGSAQPMFRRDAVESRNARYDTRFSFGEDVLFFAQLISIAGSFGVCGYPGYAYRLPTVGAHNLSLTVDDQGCRTTEELLSNLRTQLSQSGRLWLHLRSLHFGLTEWRVRLTQARLDRKYTEIFLLVFRTPKAWLWLALRIVRTIYR